MLGKIDLTEVLLYVLGAGFVGLWILAFLLVALLVYDLVRPKITEGRIVDKVREAERFWTQLLPFWVGKILVLIPIFHFDDEDWVLVIENEKAQRGSVWVSKEYWDSVAIGDYFKVRQQDSLEDNIEQRRAD